MPAANPPSVTATLFGVGFFVAVLGLDSILGTKVLIYGVLAVGVGVLVRFREDLLGRWR